MYSYIEKSKDLLFEVKAINSCKLLGRHKDMHSAYRQQAKLEDAYRRGAVEAWYRVKVSQEEYTSVVTGKLRDVTIDKLMKEVTLLRDQLAHTKEGV